MGKRVAGLLLAVALSAPGVSAVIAHPAAAAVAPRLTVGDVRVNEGDAGKIVVQVPIDLNVPATAKVTVTYRISAGSATPRVDFAASKKGPKVAHKSIGAKKTETAVKVTVLGDTTVEADETIFVDAIAVSGATVTRARGTVTIVNDDGAGAHTSSVARRANAGAALVAPRLSIGTPVIVEGDSGSRYALVPVTLSMPATATTIVKFTTQGTSKATDDDGDCATGDHPTVGAVTTTVVFNPGQQSATVKVPVLGNTTDDPTWQVPDKIVVTGGGATVAQPESDVIVLDDDAGPHAPVPPPVGVTLVSRPADGSYPTFPVKVASGSGCGYPASGGQRISADGRYVVFSSNADNLVANDTNGYADVFEKDLWTGAVARISVAADGTQADAASTPLGISADGQDVLFQSLAGNLVSGDDDHQLDMFLYDGTAGTLERIGDSHTPGVGTMYGSMSDDGRYVAFATTAPLTGGCSCQSVFVLDRTTSAITLVSDGPAGQLSSASFATISADGRHVAFVAQVAPVGYVVYVKDLDTGVLEAASVNNSGQDLNGQYSGASPWFPSLSADGQVVAFSAQACNSGMPSKLCGDGTLVRVSQVYLRDRALGTTEVASLTPDGQPMLWGIDSQSISADGRYVFFQTDSIAAVPECPQSGPDAGAMHIYRRDRVAGTTVRVDALPSDPCPDSRIDIFGTQSVSADGSVLAFNALPNPGGGVSATNPVAVYINRLS